MGKFFRRLRGTANAPGVVTLREEPDYSNGKYTYSGWIASMGVGHFALQVEGLNGTVELQGCNGRPEEATEWYTIEELAADGRIIVNEDLVNFVRVNATTINSGTMIAMLSLES